MKDKKFKNRVYSFTYYPYLYSRFRLSIHCTLDIYAANWTDVYSTTTGDCGTDIITFTPVNAKYVRVYGTQRATAYGYSLYDFGVYGNN